VGVLLTHFLKGEYMFSGEDYLRVQTAATILLASNQTLEHNIAYFRNNLFSEHEIDFAIKLAISCAGLLLAPPGKQILVLEA
jgi:hypothetical protein